MELWQFAADAGLAALVIVGGYFIVRAVTATVVRVAELWSSAVKRRSEADEKIADAMEKTAKHLERLTDKQEEASGIVGGMRREAQQAHGANLEMLGKLQQAIGEVPNMTADEVDKRIKPRFENIQKALGNSAASLLSASTQIDELMTWLKGREQHADIVSGQETSTDNTQKQEQT
jgi:hypothetical protein